MKKKKKKAVSVHKRTIWLSQKQKYPILCNSYLEVQVNGASIQSKNITKKVEMKWHHILMGLDKGPKMNEYVPSCTDYTWINQNSMDITKYIFRN